MKRTLRTPCYILMASLLCGFLAHQALGAASQEVERIPFALPSLKADKMPPVFFSHEKHAEAVEAKGGDCTACHTESQEYFLNSESVPPAKVVAYVHNGCVSCHASGKYGKNTGPQLATCRSCHNDDIAQSYAQKSAKK